MRTLVAAGALALGACSLAPPYLQPSPPVPAAWPTGESYSEPVATGTSVSEADLFRDPRLRALIEQALAENRDLRVAAANVAAARARVRVTRSAQFPEVGLRGAADYDSEGSAKVRASAGAGVTSFELDLFGRLANATAAERERALSSEASARTVRLALVADLATAWATFAADEEQLAISRSTAADAERSVRLTRARLTGGIAPRTDLRQAEQVLYTAQAAVAAGTATLAQDENLIQLLAGAPFDRALLPHSLDEADRGIGVVPAGSGSDVLLSRPDVLAAEYLLRAAHADIGVARAELFPRVSLSALLGVASGAVGLALGSDAAQAIFDAGGRRAGVAVSEAQRQTALAAYERAIQSAFRETADALAIDGTISARLGAARARTAAAADSFRLSEARYRGGIESYLNTLDSQRSLYAAQQAEIDVRLARIRNRIDLYRAIGGAPADPIAPTPPAVSAALR